MRQINLLENLFPLGYASYNGYKHKKPGLMDLMQGSSLLMSFQAVSVQAQAITALLELHRQSSAKQFGTDVEHRYICEYELS